MTTTDTSRGAELVAYYVERRALGNISEHDTAAANVLAIIDHLQAVAEAALAETARLREVHAFERQQVIDLRRQVAELQRPVVRDG